MRKRHTGQHSGGMAQNNNNRRPYQKYGKPQGGGSYNNNGNARPRKNYGALREKFMNQARDALSSGDRVLAEYYYQHADHYYRMMMEVQEQRARWQEQNQQAGEEAEADNEGESDAPMDEERDVDIPNNSNVLPAFLTRKVEVPQNPDQDNAVPMQEWEEEGR